MTSEISNILEELILQIRSENLPLVQVYLFGAYASNRQNDGSRIDVAIVLSQFDEDDISLTQKQLNKIKRKVDFRIEIYPFEENVFNMEDSFAAEIIKSGVKFL